MPDTLITGGTGFIGGALLRRLVGEGRMVRVVVRSVGAASAVTALGAEPMMGDILDPASIERATRGCEVVFHVAGLNAMCIADPSLLDRVNVDGTRNLVQAAASAGVRRVVYTSSAAAIGEPVGVVGTEATPHRGRYHTAYERSKHRAELAAFAEAQRHGVDLISVNPSSVQGPGRVDGTARILIAYLRGRLRFAVRTRMSVVFIDDVVRAHLDAERLGVAGERYLVSGWTVSVPEAVATFAAVTGVERRVRYLPPWFLAAAGAVIGGAGRVLRRDVGLCPEMVRALRHGHSYDGGRIESEWGFEYTPPQEWLRRTVEWYRSQGLV